MSSDNIYTVGGTVQAGGGVYIPRKADEELFTNCLEGHFTYVLTARQLGKSSLMESTARRLAAGGRRSVRIDLSKIGVKVDAEAWYVGILYEIWKQLGLPTNALKWWKEHKDLSVTQRLTLFFETVVLTEVTESVVVFIDEIDTTLNLDFTDDFFTTVRYMHNARAQMPVFRRISFVLIGVATPSDLIQDPRRTPFNIGHPVSLTDFTLEEASPLAKGLGLPNAQAMQVMNWVLNSTGGHPYLTQRLCRMIAESKLAEWTEHDVRKLANATFIGETSGQDDNLRFVRDMLTKRVPDSLKIDVLTTYRRVRRGHRVHDEERSLAKSHLKLSGIVCRRGESLEVRNNIYRQVFDDKWVKEYIPVNWPRRLQRAAIFLGIVLVVLSIPTTVTAVYQRNLALQAKEIANQQRERAEQALQEVDRQRSIAEQNARRAEQNAQQSEKNAAEAQVQSLAAREQKELSDRRRKEAERDRLVAKEAEKGALIAQRTAEEQRARADNEARLAQLNAEKAEAAKVIAETAQKTDRLNREALSLLKNGEATRAITLLEEARSLYRQVNDSAGESEALRNIGLAYGDSGQQRIALEYYQQALLIKQATKDHKGEADMLSSIGAAYSDIGEKQKALDQFNKALHIYETLVNNPQGIADTLHKIGDTFSDLGENYDALKMYKNALQLREANGDHAGEAATLSSIGKVYSDLGEKQLALGYYNKALQSAKAAKDRSGEAATLSNIGATYSDLGNEDKATDYYNQALLFYRARDDARGEANTLLKFGTYTSIQRDTRKALLYQSQALKIYQSLGDRRGEGAVLQNIGSLQLFSGNREQALRNYEESLKLRVAVGDRRGEAITKNSIGLTYQASGDLRRALESYEYALPILENIGNPQDMAATHYYIARVERDLGRLAEAKTRVEKSIDITEAVRAKLVTKELRNSFSAAISGYHEFYIDLLMRMHQAEPFARYDIMALEMAERYRARTLLELIDEKRHPTSITTTAGLLEQENRLRQELSDKEAQYLKVLRLTRNNEQRIEANRAMEDVFIQLQDLQVQLKLKNPGTATPAPPQTLSVSQIQKQILDDDTLLLEYSLGDEHSYLWVISTSEVTTYVLPERAKVENAIRLVRTNLSGTLWNRPEGKDKKPRKSRPNLSNADARSFTADITDEIISDEARTGREAFISLSRMLLQPAAARLGKKRLAIVAEGPLNAVPFVALPELPAGAQLPQELQPVLLNHEVVLLPSASALAEARSRDAGRPPAPKTIALFADPVFSRSDLRVKRSAGEPPKPAGPSAGIRGDIGAEEFFDADLDFRRLPGTREEALSIFRLVPSGDGLLALDFSANRAMLFNSGLEQYRIIHFATHGLFDSSAPDLPSLVLSQVDEQGRPRNGFVTVRDVSNLRLSTELVVLSTCSTNSANAARGAEIYPFAKTRPALPFSFTEAFMYAGASRVLASSTTVGDDTTAELMKRFYKKMLVEKLRPAAALRATQIELWKQTDLQQPFYWASFTLVGEWR
jgi:CHAT domain-containing protein/tetratricopeptide (TPR) repeat protein